MTVRESYSKIGESYEAVYARLGNEERVEKFSKLFFKTGDFENLEKAIESKDIDNAFEYVHRMKGNSLNIGFDKFSKSLGPIVELLRPRIVADENQLDKLFTTVKSDYKKLQEAFGN